MIELSSTNALIRLMTTEKGAESWLEKYVRYKNNLKELNKDIQKYNLTNNEMEALNRYVKETYGIGLSQEQFMKVLMDKEICNFSLKEANKARKVISKKKMTEIPILKEQIFKKAINENIAKYVWDFVAAPGLGYSFSDIHSLSYSFIGFQSAYLATCWNPIYWNTACLIVNSGSLDDNEKDEKVKEKNSDYGKIAKALGSIISKGIKISLIDINESDYGFKPKVETNEILFGLKALAGINSETIELIKKGRPYVSLKDFLNRTPLNKKAMISLIKAGAFDNLEKKYYPDIKEIRVAVMTYYLYVQSSPKAKLTLQNFNTLMQKELLPDEALSFEKKVYEFNRYLKAFKKYGEYYYFDERCLNFYSQFFNLENLNILNNQVFILQKDWDKIYKKVMEKAKIYLKENEETLLKELNKQLFLELWNKYAKGNVSYWEMESLCFYYHEHELKNVNLKKYGIVNFFSLPESPNVDYFFKRNGKEIPIYKTYKIIGTVIGKNDIRSSVTILTTNGVVNVKFTKEYYAMFNRQISEIQNDGTKKVKEKSWFSRGIKIMCTGFRREDTFVAKTYKNTSTHQLYKITEIDQNGILSLQHERYQVKEVPNE